MLIGVATLFASFDWIRKMNRIEDSPSVLPASRNDTDQYIVMQITTKTASVVSEGQTFFSTRIDRDAETDAFCRRSRFRGMTCFGEGHEKEFSFWWEINRGLEEHTPLRGHS